MMSLGLLPHWHFKIFHHLPAWFFTLPTDWATDPWQRLIAAHDGPAKKGGNGWQQHWSQFLLPVSQTPFFDALTGLYQKLTSEHQPNQTAPCVSWSGTFRPPMIALICGRIAENICMTNFRFGIARGGAAIICSIWDISPLHLLRSNVVRRVLWRFWEFEMI